MPGRAIPAALPLLIVAARALRCSLRGRSRRGRRGTAAPPPAAQIDLKRTIEDKQEMLVATVTANGKPVAGATVAFRSSALVRA